MNDQFAPPHIRATDNNPPPACPRRLLNERVYLERADDAMAAPMTGARKMRLRFQNQRQILVNDAGMVRAPAITGVIN